MPAAPPLEQATAPAILDQRESVRTDDGVDAVKIQADPQTGSVVIRVSAREAARYAKDLFAAAIKSSPEILKDHTPEPSNEQEQA